MGGGAEIAFGWRVISGRLIDIKVHSTPDYTRSNSGIEQENNLYFEIHQPSLRHQQIVSLESRVWTLQNVRRP